MDKESSWHVNMEEIQDTVNSYNGIPVCGPYDEISTSMGVTYKLHIDFTDKRWILVYISASIYVYHILHLCIYRE